MARTVAHSCQPKTQVSDCNSALRCSAAWLDRADDVCWTLGSCRSDAEGESMSGWWFQPLWKIWKVSWDDDIPKYSQYIMENKNVWNHQPDVFDLSLICCLTGSFSATMTGKQLHFQVVRASFGSFIHHVERPFQVPRAWFGELLPLWISGCCPSPLPEPGSKNHLWKMHLDCFRSRYVQ